MALRPHSVETPLEKVLGALRAHGEQPKLNGSGYVSRCPAHEDSTPSLSISEGKDGACIFHCHAECPPDRILDELDLTWEDLFPARQEQQRDEPMRQVAEYDYVDEAGTPLFQVVRFEPKTFRQRRLDSHGRWVWGLGDTRRVLYRLDAVNTTAENSGTVYIVEGEKDADTLAALGHTATCNPMGAGKWDDEYAQSLKGASVVVVADRDDTGRAHARVVARSLEMLGIPTQLLEPAAGKDTTDHLAEGLTLDELVPMSDEVVVSAAVIEIQKKYPVMNWSEFRDSAPETIDWLVEGILATGQQAFIGAPAKYGKTWVADDLAVSIVTETPFLDRFIVPKAAPVLYLALEGQASALRTRFGCLARGHGINPHSKALDDLHIRPRIPGINLADETWAEWIIEQIRQTEAKLLVVDVLRKAMPNLRESGDGATDFSKLIANLAPIAELGCAIEFLHHFLKRSDGTKDRSVLEMLVGSGALGGHADNVMGIGKREKEGQLIRRLMVECDGRDEATPEPFTIHLEGAATGPHGGWCFDDTLTLRAIRDEPKKKTIDKRELLAIEIITWISEQPESSARPEDIRAHFSLAKDELYNLRRDFLDDHIEIEGSGPSTKYTRKDTA